MIFEQSVGDRKVRVFALNSAFLDTFKDRQPEWGPVGYFVYMRTYSRELPDGTNEDWWQTCRRIIEGTFNIQKIHCRQQGLPWDEAKAQASAQDMYRRMFEFKWSPPGRGLWVMGTDVVYERGGACLQNCAMHSTDHIGEDFSAPFAFLMDMSMLGVGVGLDVRGAGKVKICNPKTSDVPFSVEDTREGWVALIRNLLDSFVGKSAFPLIIDYSKVRGRGVPLKTLGGVASGPRPLQDLVENLTQLLLPEGVSAVWSVVEDADAGTISTAKVQITGSGEPYKIGSAKIVDIANYIGKAVVAGGIRRCLPKGTLVHTSVGLIPIEKVTPGMQVMTSKNYSRVTDWVYQGEQPLTAITTQMGVFECTDKHKIAVISDTIGGYFWKKANELVPGDRMVFVDRTIEGQEQGLPSFEYLRPTHSTTCKDICIPELTSEVAWFFGLFHGDGCVQFMDDGNKGSVGIAVNGEHLHILERVKAVFDLFGVHYGVIAPKEENCYKVTASSKQLALYMSKFKVAKKSIQVPDFVLTGKPGIRAAYVAGLADADGCFRNRPIVIAASVYPEYLNQVQAVLASLGIPSRLMLHKDVQRAARGRQLLYHLTLVGDKAIQKFKTVVVPYISKFEDSRKTPRSQNDYGFPAQMAIQGGITGRGQGKQLWAVKSKQITVATLEKITGREVSLVPVEVLRIEHGVRTAETYDISVEAGEFVAQGGYLVHNTAEIVFGEPEDEEFMTLKQDMEALKDRRWASNNSIFARVGMDYAKVAESIAVNGEPGVLWLENTRAFSRMGHPADYKDRRAMGTNPCFAGETLIAVADGRGSVSIKQLAEEGKDVPVYSLNKEGRVGIKWGRHPRMTRESAPLVQVVLDDGSSFKVTPDHKMLLLNGSQCEAKDLQQGDSLPRFTKELAQISTNNRSRYVKVRVDVNAHKSEMEHRMIAQFYQPDRWKGLYDASKKVGWVKGGLVVHHKDFNPLNNTPGNLDIMTFRDHQNMHARLADVSGEKNGMWGKHHSEEAKQKIGEKTKQRCSDPVFLQKLSDAQGDALRKEASRRMSAEQKVRLFDYYKEQETFTDLDTVWLNDRLYAVKHCEVCGAEMVLPWSLREKAYCSISCHNKVESFTQKRLAGQAVVFADTQRQRLHQQISVYKDLADMLGRAPLKSEWETKCREDGVPVRFRTKGTTENPFALSGYRHLQEVATTYNHRVREVRILDIQEPVYNITVDDNHTVGIILGVEGCTTHGIFTANCGEQPLESGECCNLVETYPAHHDTYEDFEKTLKMAYLYAKTVTLVPTHNQKTNAVMTRNRRIGCSMSGIVQAYAKHGHREFLNWCDKGYDYIQKIDRVYSDWLGIPLSIKTTTVKPSGSVSLLCGATPGIHYPHSQYYIRHIRVQNTSPLVQAAIDAGYQVEPDTYADNTSVIAFPVKEKHYLKGKEDVTMWEQFLNAADLQHHWADNQISCTVSFKRSEVSDIKQCLEVFEDKLKGISMLPLADSDHGYKHAPYVAISEEKYLEMMSRIKHPIRLNASAHDKDSEDKFCTGDTCVLKLG